MINQKKLKPFGYFCKTIGMMPTSYKMSLTYEEQLLWFCDFLENKVIPAYDNNAKALEELQNLYIQLKEYVDKYFEDLSVQEEINNKLDEMASDGTLERIINQEIFAEINQKIDDEITNRQEAVIDLQNEISNEEIARNTADEILNDKIDNIQKMLSAYDIKLTNHIIYDILNGTYNQGMTIDKNSNMYIYQNIDNNVGNILVFNINDFSLVRTIPNIQFYHGGDLIVKDNCLYANDYNVNMSIVKYNLINGQRDEYHPFIVEPSLNRTLGLADYDENHILALAGTLPSGQAHINSFSQVKLFKIDINNWSMEEMRITNDNDFKLDFYCFQSMEYNQGKLYIMLSYPNMIIELEEVENSFNISKIYNIPERDEFGLKVGEMQGISLIRSNTFGKNSFMITSITIENNETSTIQAYVFSFDSELQNPLKKLDIAESGSYRRLINCDSNANQYVFYENGSVDYPFKTLRRALVFANYSPLAQGKQIKLHTGNYVLKSVTYLDGVIIGDFSHTGDIIFNDAIEIYNSNIVFDGNNNDNKFKFMKYIKADNTKLRISKCLLDDIVRVENGTDLTLNNCNLTDVDRQQIILGISTSVIKLSNNTFANQAQYIYLASGCVVFCDNAIADNKISKSGVTYVIKSST